MNNEPILGFQGEYRFLSNFHPSTFTVHMEFDGALYPVEFSWNEQYFMFHKDENLAYQRKIIWAKTPGECKRIGRTANLRPDWEAIKDHVMLSGLRAKFNQDDTLAEQLLATGKRYLEETNTWGDRYWGVDRYGKNRLGILLMQVRAELQDAVGDFNDSARMSVTGETLAELG